MAPLSRNVVALWIAQHLLPACLALIGIMLALGYVFVFRGELARIASADRAQRLQEERTAKEAFLQKLDELDAQYQAFDAEDALRVRQMIPREDDVPGLLAILEAAARAADIDVTAVNFSAGDTTGLTDVKGLGALNMAISIQHGDYRRFKLFLDALEANLRLFDVQSANINPSAANYSLTIRAYVWTANAV